MGQKRVQYYELQYYERVRQVTESELFTSRASPTPDGVCAETLRGIATAGFAVDAAQSGPAEAAL
jgi:hypothetical protein